jgi:hypothetical protein
MFSFCIVLALNNIVLKKGVVDFFQDFLRTGRLGQVLKLKLFEDLVDQFWIEFHFGNITWK